MDLRFNRCRGLRNVLKPLVAYGGWMIVEFRGKLGVQGAWKITNMGALSRSTVLYPHRICESSVPENVKCAERLVAHRGWKFVNSGKSGSRTPTVLSRWTMCYPHRFPVEWCGECAPRWNRSSINMVYTGVDSNNSSGIQIFSHVEVPTKYQYVTGIHLYTGRTLVKAWLRLVRGRGIQELEKVTVI